MKYRIGVTAALIGGALLVQPLAAEPGTGGNTNATWSLPPGTVYSPPGLDTSINFTVQAVPGTQDNAAGLTCSPTAGSTCTVTPAFVPLWTTPTSFKVTLHAANQGSFPYSLILTTGINGGADDPPVTIGPNTLSTYLPTYNNTLAHFAGEPISTATGELYDPPTPPDLSLGGLIPLEFRRYYASQMVADGLTTRIGNNWMHNFEWLLTLNGNQAKVTEFGGHVVTFNKSGTAWTLASPEQFGDQLVGPSNNSYQFLDLRTNLIYTFTGTGNALGNTSIQDRNGNTLTIALPVNGSSMVSDGLGRSLLFTYDPTSGRLMRVADQSGRFVGFGYTGNDLTQFTDAAGKITMYSYTTAGPNVGLLTAKTLPLGNKPQSQTWDQFGRVATQSDSRSNTATMTYDLPPGSATYKDALGWMTTDTSQNYSNFLTFTDPDGHNLSAGYDAGGRRNSVTDRLGNTISLTFHVPSGYPATVTDAAGNTTSNTWLPQISGPFTFYVLSKTQYADGTSDGYTYDLNGNMLTAADRLGKMWHFTYNGRGQRLMMTDPDNHTVKYAYNPSDATLASMTDSANNVTLYGYDALKRLNLTTFANGSTQSATYDALNRIIVRGGMQSAFNDNGKLVSTSNGAGNPATMTYDSDEHEISRTDYLGQTTTYAYNQVGLNKSTTTPMGETFTYNFDTHYRLSASLDSLGHGFSYAYDKEDGPASVTDALLRKTSYTTNKLGFTTQLTSPLNENYAFGRNFFGLGTSFIDPSGITAGATYDPRGLANSLSIGNLTSHFQRSDGGFLMGVADPMGNYWTYGADAAGRLATRTDPLMRTTTFAFDQLNRISAAQMPGGSLNITYGMGNSIVRRLYSDATDLNYTFGSGGLLTGAPGLSLSYNANRGIIGSNGLVIGHDADNRIDSITYAPGKTVLYGYTPGGQLGSVTDWLGGSYTFTYNIANEWTASLRQNGLGTHYGYDLDGRVGSINDDSGWSETILRDGAGKALSRTFVNPFGPILIPGVLPLNYDAANQVSGFDYTGMGFLQRDSWRTYDWDLASRLKSYSGSDGAGLATYDGLGLRISLNTPAGLQNFVWNYATAIPTLAITRNATADQTYYVSTPWGIPLYSIDAATNARSFYHYDDLWSTVALSNDAGVVTDTYGTTPYGEIVTHDGPSKNPFTWLGGLGVWQEGTTSLFYMRGRYFDSATARFISPDPGYHLDPFRVNSYQYGFENPIRYANPTGLSEKLADLLGTGSQPSSSPLRFLPEVTSFLDQFSTGPQIRSYNITGLQQLSGGRNSSEMGGSSSFSKPLQISGKGSGWGCGCGKVVAVGFLEYRRAEPVITERPKPAWMLQNFGDRIPQISQWAPTPTVRSDEFFGAAKKVHGQNLEILLRPQVAYGER